MEEADAELCGAFSPQDASSRPALPAVCDGLQVQLAVGVWPLLARSWVRDLPPMVTADQGTIWLSPCSPKA